MIVLIDNLIKKALAEGYRNTAIDTKKSDVLFVFLLAWRREHENRIDDVPDSTKEHGP